MKFVELSCFIITCMFSNLVLSRISCYNGVQACLCGYCMLLASAHVCDRNWFSPFPHKQWRWSLDVLLESSCGLPSLSSAWMASWCLLYQIQVHTVLLHHHDSDHCCHGYHSYLVYVLLICQTAICACWCSLNNWSSWTRFVWIYCYSVWYGSDVGGLFERTCHIHSVVLLEW